MTLSSDPSPACSPETSELFYSYKADEIRKAKEICNSCPLKRACLENALETSEIFGVWGGASYSELRVAKSLDINGEKHEYESPIRCLWCGPHSTKYLEPVRRKGGGTEIVCTNCNLTWVSKKIITKKKRNF